MSDHVITQFFAWTPLVAFIAVLGIAYAAKRNERSGPRPATGRTYACARCGRRGRHEHMVPVTHEGAVVWYCGRCAQAAH